MDAIEAGYTTPPNREDSEQVADSDESEPDEQGEKGGEDEGGQDECEASEEECDDDEDDERTMSLKGKPAGASDDSMSVGSVHGLSLLFQVTTGPLCSTLKLTQRYWRLPSTSGV
jgi:hypothetical protein